MGEKSRKRLPPDTRCYLCGEPIAPIRGTWNRDHIPPDSFFGASIKQAFNLQLRWEYTHTECNTSYKKDEEYFVASMAIHAGNTVAAKSVLADYKAALQQGHMRGLYRECLGQMGTVQTSDGMIPVYWTYPRIKRVLWKLVRGLFYMQTSRILPEAQAYQLDFFLPNQREKLEETWFAFLQPSMSMSHVGGVLDVKAMGIPGEGIRGHCYALLIWDALIVLAAFHDPTCSCGGCLREAN